MSVLVLILLVVVAAVGGVVAYRADSTGRAAIAQAMSAFSASFAIGFVLLYVGPRFKETFIGFGVELPGLTVWAVHVVDLALTYAPFILLNLVGSSVLGVVLFFWAIEIRNLEERRRAGPWLPPLRFRYSLPFLWARCYCHFRGCLTSCPDPANCFAPRGCQKS